MFVKKITYVDYNGEERTDECRFHLSPAELTELECMTPGGLKATLETYIEKKDTTGVMEFFKKLVKMSYGVKSPDGRRFMKSEEIWREFSETEAYVELFMQLVTDETAAKEFAEKVIPDMKKYTAQNTEAAVR